jgi:hypothetical protein
MAKRMISLEISDELREALRKEAFNNSVSISAMIRQILEDRLFNSCDEVPEHER